MNREYIAALFTLFISYQVYSSFNCDCGIIWNDGWPVGRHYHAYYDHPVTRIEQIQHICYLDLNCTGIAYNPILQEGYLLQYSSSNSAVPGQSWLANAVFKSIDRNSLYRCSSMTLDPFYYYFHDHTVRELIEDLYCPVRLENDNSCCWDSSVSPTTLSGCTADPTTNAQARLHGLAWITSATTYWNLHGHRRRHSPNANCLLTPTLWTAASNCLIPQEGCYTTGGTNGIPCNSNGVCIPNPNNSTGLYKTPYICDCFNNTAGAFSDPSNSNAIVPKFIGNACGKSTTVFCTSAGNTDELCNGHATRCRPSRVSVPLTPTADYQPACMCDNATALGPWPALTALNTGGQYCSINRCDEANSCQILSSSSVCSYDSTIHDWKCSCGTGFVGRHCQYPATECLTGSVICSGHGVCVAPDFTGTAPGTITNFNNTKPWCSCTTPFTTGPKCSLYTCNTTRITAGHGHCNPTNGAFIDCYPPIFKTVDTTKPLCDKDVCAAVGGTATLGTPTVAASCDCGLSIPDPTFVCKAPCVQWLGETCGPGASAEVNTCEYINGDMSLNVFTRKSDCVCGNGFVRVGIPKNKWQSVTDLPLAPPIVNGIEEAHYCVNFCGEGVMASYDDDVTFPHCTSAGECTPSDTDPVCVCPDGVDGKRCERNWCTPSPYTIKVLIDEEMPESHGTWNEETQKCECSVFWTGTNCSEELNVGGPLERSNSSSSSTGDGVSVVTNSTKQSDINAFLDHGYVAPIVIGAVGVVFLAGLALGTTGAGTSVAVAMTTFSAIAGAGFSNKRKKKGKKVKKGKSKRKPMAQQTDETELTSTEV
jgi:hypothetical protein